MATARHLAAPPPFGDGARVVIRTLEAVAADAGDGRLTLLPAREVAAGGAEPRRVSGAPRIRVSRLSRCRLVRENHCCKGTREYSRGSGGGTLHGDLPSPLITRSYSKQ